MKILRPYLINLPKIVDERGNLTFLENPENIPFEIKRAYWIYDIPSGQTRGGHAFKSQNEMIVALSGSVEVYTSDGEYESSIVLNRPSNGYFIPKMTWRQIRNFSSNAVVLIINSHPYDSEDYIYDYSKFATFK